MNSLKQLAEEILYKHILEDAKKRKESDPNSIEIHTPPLNELRNDSLFKMHIPPMCEMYSAAQSKEVDIKALLKKQRENCLDEFRKYWVKGSIESGILNAPEPSLPIKDTADSVQGKEFTYFQNHGDEEGRGCFTICYAGKDEFGDFDFDTDCVIVAVDDKEEDAKEACARLNRILSQQNGIKDTAAKESYPTVSDLQSRENKLIESLKEWIVNCEKAGFDIDFIETRLVNICSNNKLNLSR